MTRDFTLNYSWNHSSQDNPSPPGNYVIGPKCDGDGGGPIIRYTGNTLLLGFAQEFKPVYPDIAGIKFSIEKHMCGFENDANPYIQCFIYEGDTLPGKNDYDGLFGYNNWVARSQKIYYNDIPNMIECSEHTEYGPCIGDFPICSWSYPENECFNTQLKYWMYATFDECVDVDVGETYYIVWLGDYAKVKQPPYACALDHYDGLYGAYYIAQGSCNPQYKPNVGWGYHYRQKPGTDEYWWERVFEYYVPFYFQIWSMNCRFWDWSWCGEYYDWNTCVSFCEDETFRPPWGDSCNWWWSDATCRCSPAPLGAPAEDPMPPAEYCAYYDDDPVGCEESPECYYDYEEGRCKHMPPYFQKPMGMQNFKKRDVWLF